MLAPLALSLALVAASTPVSASPAPVVAPAFNRRHNDLPEGVYYFDPLSFAYTPGNVTRDQRALWIPPINSTANATQPSFQAFHPDFLTLLGDSPSIKIIAENATYAFAHEAAIWNPETNEFIFAANAGGPLGDSGIDKNNKIFKVSLNDYDGNSTLPYTEISPSNGAVEMVNGGTPFRGAYLFTAEGRGDIPPSLSLVNAYPPYNTTTLLNNFFGRTFNSVNDLQVHKPSGLVFFTDTLYGYLQDFRPYPTLPEQVYSFNADTGVVRAVADGFGHVNGITFSPDYSKVYLADTGAANGTFDAYRPATIYVYNVDTSSSGAITFSSRKLFAYADTGVPDGLKVDTSGNVYVGCGDGIHVWNPDGDLLGKIYLGTGSANLAFAGEAGLIILAETKVFIAKFGGVVGPDLWNL